MKNKYKAMFDDLAPVRGDKELFQAVLDRKAENKMAAKFSKKVFIPVIAAAVLGTTAVGASAAYQWSQAQALQRVFEKEGNVEADYPTFDLNRLGGKELSDVIECDNFTIKTTGIAADEHTAYLFYDLIFDEGYDCSLAENEEWQCSVFPRLEIDWIKEYWGLGLENRDDSPGVHSGGHGGVLDTEGNVVHMFSVFTISGITLPGKTLNYEGMGPYRYNSATKETVEDLSGEFGFSVDIDFVTTKSVSVKPNKRVKLASGEEGTFTYAEVSPFTLIAEVDWDIFEQKFNGNEGNLSPEEREERLKELEAAENSSFMTNGKFEVNDAMLDEMMASLKVKFKDGTVKDINAFAISNHSAVGAMRLAWEYPVDVEQIESVTIGDAEIEF